MMKQIHRDPQTEEGVRNVVLQNRCGNRLTLLGHDDRAELEFIYKPDARRRKEFRARNFSNRDNFSPLFQNAELPEVGVGMITRFEYDPFVTRLETQAEGGASNRITVVNPVEANAFALAARAPLTLCFTPHERFVVEDGLITETFRDRGETITSFIAFAGLEANRYRVLDDDRHVLQIFEEETIIVGGEENPDQARRAADHLAGRTLYELINETEDAVRPVLEQGRLHLRDDPKAQRVLDLNRRVTWSGLDEGGACFGALNRIYHLIWTRDGSMAAATFAQAGLPDPVRIWTPFLLDNPSEFRDEQGRTRREFTQLVGTRWSKTEDDGIYYAVLSLFALNQSTGEDRPLRDGRLSDLLDILDHTIATRFDEQRGLFGSDVLGEDPLGDSPYFGYDIVNGKMIRGRKDSVRERMRYCYTLYQNLNMYNGLRMADVLIARADDPALTERAEGYRRLADRIAAALAERFVNDDGCYRALLAIMDDGSEQWREFAPRSDYWEYAWAVSMGPFMPDPATSLRSSRMAVEVWPTIRTYGFCPWNFLARYLKEHGLPSAAYRKLLDEQIDEALTEGTKYPMTGALTEYQHAVEGWRGLPFGAGSLNLSLVSLLLQPLPLGLAVRASTLADRLERFCYRTARLDVTAQGDGDVVTGVTLNGRPLEHTLQLPEDRLQAGPNRIEIERGASFDGFRLYSSNAALLSVDHDGPSRSYHLDCPFEAQLIFDRYESAAEVAVESEDGKALDFSTEPIEDTGRTLVRIGNSGRFVLTAKL